MLALTVKLLMAPALVAAAGLAARSRGERAGGRLSALPAIAGPVLLIDAQAHGEAFAGRAAAGTLVGLVALAAFLVAYARVALRRGPPASLAAGWAAFAVVALAIAPLRPGALAATGAAVGSLLAARTALPRTGRQGAPDPVRGAVWPQAAAALALVAALSAAAGPAGDVAGGVLVAVPVVASVLAVFAHARSGGRGAAALLAGMTDGMFSFAAFCAVVAIAGDAMATGVVFVLATAAAVAIHVAAARFVAPLRAPCASATS